MIAAAPGAQFVLLVAEANRRLFSFDPQQVALTTLHNNALHGANRTIIEHCLVSRWLRQIRADVYFVPYGWLPRRLPCPAVWTFQNLLLLGKYQDFLTPPLAWRHRVREWLRGWLVSRILLPTTINADRIIAVSQSAKDDLSAQYPQCRERICVVHEGVGAQFNDTTDEAADAVVLSRLRIPVPYYLSVSTLMKHKNHESLIRAFVRFKSISGTTAALVIIGADWGGYRKRLQRLVGHLQAQQYIHFPGHVDPADLPAVYRNARSFVLLSPCESFGLPAAEAMACGCPTVVADVGGLAEVVAGGGSQVNPGDIAGVADVLLRLEHSPTQRSALARTGKARATQFPWKVAAQKTVAVFEQVLNLSISPRRTTDFGEFLNTAGHPTPMTSINESINHPEMTVPAGNS